MTPPLVSIVIDNFNYARFLPQSIGSALAQAYPRTEVIVVDDGSDDGSHEVIRGFGDKVIPILLPANRGQGGAFNAGFAASHGDLIVFLDADDFLHPHAVAAIVAAWRPGLTKVQYRLDLVDEVGNVLGLMPPTEIRFESGDVVPMLLANGRYETNVTSGNAFARDALHSVMPVPEEDFRLSADGYLVTQVPFYGAIASLEESLGAYRLHGANAWAQGTPDLGEHLRRSLEHDGRKYRAILARCAKLGLTVSSSLGMRDAQHLATRLGSLVLAPGRHPHPEDHRIALALRGIVAACRASTAWIHRGAMAAWFLAAGTLPRPLATRAVRWRIAPWTRPAFLARFLRQFRRALLDGKPRPAGPANVEPAHRDGE